MSKPSVRQTILLKSVQQLLDDGESVSQAVVLTTRHRLFVPYTAVSAIALYVVATLSGFTTPASRIALTLCGAAIAAIATTNTWVLADTSKGLALFRSSRIRQYAKELVQRLPADEELEMVASNVITSDWRIDGVIYTLTKRWEATMRQLSMQ